MGNNKQLEVKRVAECDGCGVLDSPEQPLVCEKKRIDGVVAYLYFCPQCFSQTPEATELEVQA